MHKSLKVEQITSSTIQTLIALNMIYHAFILTVLANI